jgi:ubiquinone/menaquinone biosynthesis C-methylase UbiE
VGQPEIDSANRTFWSELCGTHFARALGIDGTEPEDLRKYDAAYFDYYPYLKGYVDRFDLRGKPVLEIGLGYGTLGQYLAEAGADYHGLDVAATPTAMMRERLRRLGDNQPEQIVEGSALSIPWPDESFAYVYSIGCLHHTGDIRRAIGEVTRVLTQGGVAVVMLYNRHSARQLWSVDRRSLLSAVKLGRAPNATGIRGQYDINEEGVAAPHTDFTSRSCVRKLFANFANVRITAENFDTFGHPTFRQKLLRTPLPRVFGLDLYIVAHM